VDISCIFVIAECLINVLMILRAEFCLSAKSLCCIKEYCVCVYFFCVLFHANLKVARCFQIALEPTKVRPLAALLLSYFSLPYHCCAHAR
jgi:hypothetical protein